MSGDGGVRVVLIAHAPLASAMREVAVHAFPECASMLTCLDVASHASLDDVTSKLESLLDGRPTLMLVDVLGATPANAVQRLLSEREGLLAVAGLNVAMLWRVLCYRHEDIDALADRALTGGQRGILAMGNPS